MPVKETDNGEKQGFAIVVTLGTGNKCKGPSDPRMAAEGPGLSSDLDRGKRNAGPHKLGQGVTRD